MSSAGGGSFGWKLVMSIAERGSFDASCGLRDASLYGKKHSTWACYYDLGSSAKIGRSDARQVRCA